MRAVIDSSTLISLAWSGQLRLLTHVPIDLVVPDEVRQETVVGGLDRGYPDAAAIELAIKDIPNTDAVGDVHADSVDNVVLEAARADGVLFTNDLALGRRAANLGVQWLRTADLVVLCVRSGRLNAQDGVTALRALRSAGRITDNLLREYLRELS